MSEERRQILDMLAEGKINAEEAEKLLMAIEKDASQKQEKPEFVSDSTESGKKLKSLCIMVESKTGTSGGKKEKVNIKVPIQIIRAGIKLGSVLPGDAKEKVNEALKNKGIDLDLNNLVGDTTEKLYRGLAELNIDIDDENNKVRIYCE
jgi:hypothetical protein